MRSSRCDELARLLGEADELRQPLGGEVSDRAAAALNDLVDAVDGGGRARERGLELGGDGGQVGGNLVDRRVQPLGRGADIGGRRADVWLMMRSALVKVPCAAVIVCSAAAIAGSSRARVALASRKVCDAESSVVPASADQRGEVAGELGHVAGDLIDRLIDGDQGPSHVADDIRQVLGGAFSTAAIDRSRLASVVRASDTRAAPSPSTRGRTLVAAVSTEARWWWFRRSRCQARRSSSRAASRRAFASRRGVAIAGEHGLRLGADGRRPRPAARRSRPLRLR